MCTYLGKTRLACQLVSRNTQKSGEEFFPTAGWLGSEVAGWLGSGRPNIDFSDLKIFERVRCVLLHFFLSDLQFLYRLCALGLYDFPRCCCWPSILLALELGPQARARASRGGPSFSCFLKKKIFFVFSCFRKQKHFF